MVQEKQRAKGKDERNESNSETAQKHFKSDMQEQLDEIMNEILRAEQNQ